MDKGLVLEGASIHHRPVNPSNIFSYVHYRAKPSSKYYFLDCIYTWRGCLRFYDLPPLGFVLAPYRGHEMQVLAQSTEIFHKTPFMSHLTALLTFPAETVAGPCHRLESYHPLLSRHAQKRAKSQGRGTAGSLPGDNLICLEL